MSESIRRSIREGGSNLLDELRGRPADQKVMFAVSANCTEIDALRTIIVPVAKRLLA